MVRIICATSRELSSAEQAIASVAESGQDISLCVELTIERRAVDLHIGMCRAEPSHAFGCGDETQKTDPHARLRVSAS